MSQLGDEALGPFLLRYLGDEALGYSGTWAVLRAMDVYTPGLRRSGSAAVGAAEGCSPSG